MELWGNIFVIYPSTNVSIKTREEHFLVPDICFDSLFSKTTFLKQHLHKITVCFCSVIEQTELSGFRCSGTLIHSDCRCFSFKTGSHKDELPVTLSPRAGSSVSFQNPELVLKPPNPGSWLGGRVKVYPSRSAGWSWTDLRTTPSLIRASRVSPKNKHFESVLQFLWRRTRTRSWWTFCHQNLKTFLSWFCWSSPSELKTHRSPLRRSSPETHEASSQSWRRSGNWREPCRHRCRTSLKQSVQIRVLLGPILPEPTCSRFWLRLF